MLTANLNKRFCRDTGTSIAVFIDPYFSERIKLLGLEQKYSDFEKMINEQFGGIEQRYFEYCEQVEKEVLAFLKESESLKGLQTCDMNKYKNPFSIPSGNVYKGDNVDKKYISIDMAKANFSALVHYEKEIEVGNAEKSFGQLCGYDYSKFIGHFTDNKFVAESKYVRQYIFGHCCSKRVVNYEKWIMGTVMDKLPASAVNKVVTLNNDEIIIDAGDLTLEEVNGIRILVEQLSEEIVPLHFEYFTLKGFYGTEQKVFMKQFIDENGQQNGYKLACNNSIDTVFIEKYLHGIEITDNDLVFNCQYGLAKLLKVPEAYTKGIKNVQ